MVQRTLQRMRDLLKFAESWGFDCFLTKPKDAGGDINYLWGVSISQSQATWETIRGQHAARNEICSCQINHLEISPCPFTSILCQEKSFWETEPAWGWGARDWACKGVPTRLQLAGRCPENPARGAWRPSWPAAHSPWDLGQVTPSSGLS